MIGNKMEFPETFQKFANDYGFKDDKEIYTNGSDLIPIFRVEQWLEHDNKLRKLEIETAYECGKHANNKWIPVSERLPEQAGEYLVTYRPYHWGETFREHIRVGVDSFRGKTTWAKNKYQKVIAWMPLPKPYNAENEE